MRSVTVVCGILVVIMMLTGCNQKAELSNEEHFFTNFKNYEAQVTICFMKDTQSNELKMKQRASLDDTYEIELQEPSHLAGIRMSSDGKEIQQYFPSTQKTISSKMSTLPNEILLTSFVERYLACKEAQRGEEQLHGKRMITFEVPMEGNNKYMVKEKIWLDYEKKLPVQLVIFDVEGKVTLQCEYENFKYNL